MIAELQFNYFSEGDNRIIVWRKSYGLEFKDFMRDDF